MSVPSRYADVAPTEVMPGIMRRVLAWGERLMLVEFTFEGGLELPMHSHPHEQLSHMISGEMEFRLGDEVHVLYPGDSLLIPSDLRHGVLARQKTVVIDAFSPPREEFVGMHRRTP